MGFRVVCISDLHIHDAGLNHQMHRPGLFCGRDAGGDLGRLKEVAAAEAMR